MLLTITTTHRPANDLGYLLHKHPERFQTFDLSFGKAHVFYPEVECRAVYGLPAARRGRRGHGPRQERRPDFLLAQYVNDRPYAASSFMSVAIAQVFGSALQGRCKDRPELAATPIPLTARIDVLPVRGGERFLRGVFEPLGYEVEAVRCPLDERFPEWGESPYFSVTVRKTTTLAELLTHLYVLIPVFDNRKHYWVGDDEMEKLLAKGEGWLADHPEKEEITRRYLKFQPSLFREALARLVQEEEPVEAEEDDAASRKDRGGSGKAAQPQRTAARGRRGGSAGQRGQARSRPRLRRRQADPGTAQGQAVRGDRRAGCLDPHPGSGPARLKLDRLPTMQAKRVKLIHGSLMYRDKRLEGFDAAAVVEVVEHLDPPRLSAFERVLFEFARPRTVVLTTPNREYNVTWETLPAGQFRHPDHRFEWTRQEFQDWAKGDRRAVRLRGAISCGVGPEDAKRWGHQTQMGVFRQL